jgi:1-acyl-sn-glycerol-3-phosphate acyltransferase
MGGGQKDDGERAGEIPRAYRFIIWVLRLVVRAFFRRVTVTGREHIPASGGGILVSWHPNGLIDPGLLLTQLPRQVVFGARHGVFRYPLLGTLMRQIGTVPIYRASDLPNLDKAERAKANQQSLGALASEIARGSFSALFPEGVSHDAPHLLELKTGAARLYYQARAMQHAGDGDKKPAVIIPVGLHYDDKDLFRSNAMVAFYPPIELTGELAFKSDVSDEDARAQSRALTDEIERVLHDVVLATDSWPLHTLMHRARKLVRAERAHRADANPGKTEIEERVLGFARIRSAYLVVSKAEPEKAKRLIARVNEYDADLRALGLNDHDLDRSPRFSSRQLFMLLTVQVLTVYLLLPPLLLVGYLVNAPTAVLLVLFSRAVRQHQKDEATVKLLVGCVAFPLTWVGAAVAAAWGHHQLHAMMPGIPNTPILAGVLVGVLGALGGALAVRYLRIARETARAVRVRFTRRLRRRALERLRRERSDLHDELINASAHLELPGEVLADGRVVRS